MSTESASRRRRIEVVFLISLLAISAAVRVIGFDFDFPLLTHSDEYAVMEPVIRASRDHTLVPDEYKRPNHISIYVNLVAGELVSLATYHTFLAKAYAAHYLTFYGLGRILSAVFGLSLVAAMFKLGQEVKPGAGYPAALMSALFPAWVQHSHYITPDVSLGLFIALVMYNSIRYARTRRKLNLYVSLLFCALATLEKYPGVLAFCCVLYAAAYVEVTSRNAPWDKKATHALLRKFVGLCVILILCTYALSPTLFLNYKQTVKGFLTEARSTGSAGVTLGFFRNLTFYFKSYLFSAGALASALSVCGLVMFIRRKNLAALPSLFGFLYIILLSTQHMHHERWGVPFYISPILLASYAFTAALEWSFMKHHLVKAASGLLALTVVFNLALSSVYTSFVLTLTNTIKICSGYLERENISYDMIEGNLYSPLLTTSHRIMDPHPGMQNGYSARYTTRISPAGLAEERIFDYKTYAPDPRRKYILLSSSVYGRYSRDSRKGREAFDFYQRMRTQNKLIYSVQPSGPTSLSFIEWENFARFLSTASRLRHGETFTKGPRLELYEKSSL